MTFVPPTISINVGVEKGQILIKESPNQCENTLMRKVVWQIRAWTGMLKGQRSGVRGQTKLT